MDESQLRFQLCQASHQLWMRGLLAGDGGMVTAELHRRRYLATPAHARRIDLKPEQIVWVDVGGQGVQGDPVFEPTLWRPHRLAYQLHADSPAPDAIGATVFAQPPRVAALVHLHSQTDFLSLPDHPPIPLIDPDAEDDVLRYALAEHRLIALGATGVLSVGGTLAAALNAVERIEHAATVALALAQHALERHAEP